MNNGLRILAVVLLGIAALELLFNLEVLKESRAGILALSPYEQAVNDYVVRGLPIVMAMLVLGIFKLHRSRR